MQLRLTKPRSFKVFLGGFAPGVYAYILPKSATIANVLELPSVAEQLREGVVVREKSGWAPIRYFTAKWVYGNVVLVGDAANQNFKPFVEGIIPTIICGVLARETASDYLRGKGSLEGCSGRVNAKLGTFFAEFDELIPHLYEWSGTPNSKEQLLRLGLFANIISLQQLERLKPADESAILHRLELWNHSNVRQALADLVEYAGFLYLGLRNK
jgi:hypothetical protein